MCRTVLCHTQKFCSNLLFHYIYLTGIHMPGLHYGFQNTCRAYFVYESGLPQAIFSLSLGDIADSFLLWRLNPNQSKFAMLPLNNSCSLCRNNCLAILVVSIDLLVILFRNLLWMCNSIDKVEQSGIHELS